MGDARERATGLSSLLDTDDYFGMCLYCFTLYFFIMPLESSQLGRLIGIRKWRPCDHVHRENAYLRFCGIMHIFSWRPWGTLGAGGEEKRCVDRNYVNIKYLHFGCYIYFLTYFCSSTYVVLSSFNHHK